MKILRQYIDDNLTNNRIRRFIANVDASIFFIFKSNEKFRLCVNYKNLNAITLKNKILLSFIDEIFDRLIETKYFTQLNLKNVYHKIRIKKNE